MASGQDVRPRPAPVDTLPADTTPRRALTAGDTIKAPLPVPYAPLLIGARGAPMHWDRAALFANGALTLGELLAEIPGVTLMSSGFLVAPAVVTWHGDPGGVRIFLDGIERDEITPRTGGVTDFSLLPLWALEDVAVEETAGELRVHARTWRVDRTTASTRTDVLTGSDNLNLFRGYFGKRASSGLAIQVAAQQASTVEPLTNLDGGGLGAFARVGWAAGSWDVDATWLRQGMNRNAGSRYLLSTPQTNALPAFHGSATLAYLRLAWRSPERPGPWAQLIASTQGAVLTPSSASTTTAADTASADTATSQGAYTGMVGVNTGGLRVATGARVRSRNGAADVTPLARLDLDRPWGGLAVAAEHRENGAMLWDVRARGDPFSWLRVSASTGVSQPSGWGLAPDATLPAVSERTNTRNGSTVDAALGFRGRWIGVGLVHMATGTVLAPVELDTAMRAVTVPAASGIKASLAVPLARGWSVRTDLVRWGTATTFRPQTEAHTRLWFESNFLRYAPRGNFHVVAALTHDYRTVLATPSLTDAVGQTTPGYSAYGLLLQVRISTATVYWDFRNMTGHPYETFPGYLMPRNLSVYGIRWEFWN